MTERLSLAPTQGVFGWLQEWNPASCAVRLNGLFQPSLCWSDGGTGFLWFESVDSNQVEEAFTLQLGEAMHRELKSLPGVGGRRDWLAVPFETGELIELMLFWKEQGWSDQLSQVPSVWLKSIRLALMMVQREDVLAFASPTQASWSNVLASLYHLANPDVQEWLPWSPQPKGFSALWIPAWTEVECRALRHLYMSEASGETEIPSWFDPFLCLAVDWWTRQVLTQAETKAEDAPSKSSYHVPYRGEKDMLEVWTNALWEAKPSASFASDAWLIWRTLRQGLMDSGWQEDWLQDRSGRSYYHLDFELCPPKDGLPASDWQLVFHVAHNHLPQSAPFEAWWATRERVWTIGTDVLVHPDEWILPSLYRAGTVFAPFQEALTKPRPSACRVPSERVFDFVTSILPRLQALGCTCRIPELSEESLANIRVRVQVRRPTNQRVKSSFVPQRSTGLFDTEQLVTFDWTIVVGEDTISSAEFESMVEKNAPFVQLGGSWRLLPVQAILDQVRMLGNSKVGTSSLVQLSRMVLMSDGEEQQGVQLDVEYDEALSDIDVYKTLTILRQAHQPPLLPVPEGFQGSLRQYQQIGYSWLNHLREIGCGGCLADDMGLGKTIQVIAYLLRLEETGSSVGPHLLLCPTSLLQNWRAELLRFAPRLKVYVHHGAMRNETSAGEDESLSLNASRHHLVMTTYGTVVRDAERFGEVAWDVVIADEAQNIKNHETKQAQAVRRLPAFHRIALTGTPVENRLEELWSIFQFVNPGYLGSLTWFRRVFAGPISTQPDHGAARQLHRLLRPVLLRRRKTEPEIQLELPEKWEVSEYAGLTSEQAALYQSILNRLFGKMEEIRTDGTSAMARRGHILSALVRLKQVCDHPCLLVGGAGDVGKSGKLKLLMDVLEDVVLDGEAALVFTQFRDMGDLLCEVIQKRFGVRPKFLHGGLTAAARGQMVEDYQSGKDPSSILVLSLKAGGVGLNLTRANHVFHYDRWWNPAVEDQATDRAFRIGQTRDVQVHRIICRGTLEERIDTLIQSKRAVSAAVVGESEGWVTELDDDALRQLFALDVDASLEVEETE